MSEEERKDQFEKIEDGTDIPRVLENRLMDTPTPDPEHLSLVTTCLMLALPIVLYFFAEYNQLCGRENWVRNPLIGALLNLLPWPVGLGYVYLGRWGRVLLAWLGSTLVGLAARSSDAPEVTSAGCLVIPALSLIIACDAYQIAKRA